MILISLLYRIFALIQATQVAILTLLEGENALLELKAGDDAAKARCSHPTSTSQTEGREIVCASLGLLCLSFKRLTSHRRWVDYERGLPMFASHAHFMEAAIR